MLSRHAQPIAAIATAPGRGAVGIVRVSGNSVRDLAVAVCGRPLRPREATYLPFRAADGSMIDQGLAIHFPAPNSFTGEDGWKPPAHGGPVLLQLCWRCIEAAGDHRPAASAFGGLREGTGNLRARLLNDKIDLAQAEAIATR